MILNRIGSQIGHSGDSGDSSGGVDFSTLFSACKMRHAAYMSTGIIASPIPPEPELSSSDKLILAELEKQTDCVITQIQLTIKGKPNGFFIWGPGGHGKSYVVRQALQPVRSQVKWTTTDVSGKGLFNLLQEYPSHIHVFEDMEKMYKQADCQSILRAACGGQSIDERWIHWEKDGLRHEDPFQFTGTIIIISNEDPRGVSLKMGAIASRFAPQKWELTDPQLAAKIRDVALNTPCDYGLSAAERWEVAEFVIEEMQKRPMGIYVELRTFCEHAIPAYHHDKLGKSLTPWQDVVRAKIKGGPRRSFRDADTERLMHLACQSYFSGSDAATRVAKWTELTEKGKSQFYQYWEKARDAGIDEQYR